MTQPRRKPLASCPLQALDRSPDSGSNPVDTLARRIQFVSVRIIKEPFLMLAVKEHPKAAGYLDAWRKTVRAAAWQNLAEVRRTCPGADAVRGKSGRQVLVFNVRGNTYRLIVAGHFNRQILYTLRFFTYGDDSKDAWKTAL